MQTNWLNRSLVVRVAIAVVACMVPPALWFYTRAVYQHEFSNVHASDDQELALVYWSSKSQSVHVDWNAYDGDADPLISPFELVASVLLKRKGPYIKPNSDTYGIILVVDPRMEYDMAAIPQDEAISREFKKSLKDPVFESLAKQAILRKAEADSKPEWVAMAVKGLQVQTEYSSRLIGVLSAYWASICVAIGVVLWFSMRGHLWSRRA